MFPLKPSFKLRF